MHEDEELGSSDYLKKCRPLHWKPKSNLDLKVGDSDREESTRQENGAEQELLCFDFSDLLSELRADLQFSKNNEERLIAEIRRELDNVGKTLGGKDFIRSFDQSVARLSSEVHSYEADAKVLASNLKTASVLAENIAGRVAVLDQARGRVVECLQRVGDLRDLRTCAEGVEVAMRQEEYDEAAHHIHRFFALDNAVFKMSNDQIDVKDSGQSMKDCYNVLRKAAAELKVIIERRFDEALAKNDVASMERFFKIFPLINEHGSGLKRFGSYLCSKIEKLGEDNFKILQAGGTDDKRKNVIYADTMTMIFEGIARIIELHQPLIDNFYGPDKLLNLIEIIQVECDKQTIKVINAFIHKRQLEFKAKQVDGYVRGATENVVDRMDALELDVLLSEITLIHTRSELYWRFLKRRLGEAPARPLSESTNDRSYTSGPKSPGSPTSEKASSPVPEIEVFEDEFYETAEQRKADQERARMQRVERTQKLDTLLHRSSLSLKMQEILGKYILMEHYYMIESVKKAIEMDDVEEGSMTSTLLDDVFFIVRKSIRRSISSSSVDCVCAMLNNGVTLLETEFIKHINAPVRAGYPSVGWTAEAYQTAQTAYNVIQHGKTVAEAGPEKQKSAFLVALNNLTASIECVGSLKNGLNEDFIRHLSQISSLEKGKLENSIGQMDDLCKKLEHHVNLGIGKLCEAAFRTKIKTNAEVYLDISHNINDEELAEYEAVDPFMDNFISLLDKRIAYFESVLIPENYQMLLSTVSIETVRQIERVLFKCVFNRLGGLQLDKEYRQLTAYLTSIAGWSIREKCVRLSQIVALLNSETIDEAIEFLQQQQIGGVLTVNEMKKTFLLRTDFSKDKVRNLKL